MLQMLMWTGVSEQLIPMKLSSCDELCPLSKFESIVKPYLPNSKVKKCLMLENEY